MALASCGGGGGSGATDGTGATTTSTARATGAGDEVKAARATEPCGGGGGGGDGPASAAGGSASAGGSTEEAKRCGGKGGRSAAAGCEARIGDFVDRMTDLRQSLLAGLSYAEYVVRVRAIRDAYEAVPVDRLGVSCLSGPADAAESAFNQYLRAANTWGECAGTAGCAASEIEAKLQRRWRIASKSLEAVTRG